MPPTDQLILSGGFFFVFGIREHRQLPFKIIQLKTAD